jgi:biopolymer transport protein ExbD
MARREKPSDRRHPTGHGGDDPLDLDVTPFLNIMFMLILSIMAMTSFTQLALLTVEAPKMGGSTAAAPVNPEDAPPSQLNLTVFVLKTGFNIAASGATLDGNAENRPGEALIPKVQTKEGTTYDFRALNKKLIEIKKTFPIEENIIISADADVIYDDVIHTMDAARETEDGKVLFPSVAFAAGIVG